MLKLLKRKLLQGNFTYKKSCIFGTEIFRSNMNKCLNVIGILLALLLFPYCGKKEAQQIKWQDSRTHAALAEIDSLMWHQADSAFVLLQEFVVSPEVKELDTFDGHYCQLLISELLYKNDYKRRN